MINNNISSFICRLSITAIMLLSVTSMLTGCHGSKGLPEFTVPDTFDTSRNYEISFWAKNDSNKVQAGVYKDAIKAFEKLYPNIHVNIKQYTDYGRIYNDVITNISTNTTPNVCITYPDHIATYMTGINIVVPLDSLMNDNRYGFGGSDVNYDSSQSGSVIPEFLDEGKFEDSHYALPFMRSTEALYINEQLVHDLGYEIPDIPTWDYVWEVSEKATEKNADGTYKLNGQKVMIPFIYKSTDNMLISELKQLDAGYSDSEGNIYIFNDTTTSLLKEIAIHAKNEAFSTFAISSYPGNFLNAGQCVFAIDSTAGSTWMGSNAPLSDIADENKVEFNTVVRPLPQFDTNNIKMISQGPSLCLFNKEDPQEVLASYLFAQYLLTNEVQTAYSMSEGYVPVTNSARESQAYTDYLNKAGSDNDVHYSVKMDATNLLLNNTENTFVTPVFNGSASLRSASSALIEDVVKSCRRKSYSDTDEFFEKEYASVKSLYHLDQINTTRNEKQDLGPLPLTSIALIMAIGICWVLIAIYFIRLISKSKNAK